MTLNDLHVMAYVTLNDCDITVSVPRFCCNCTCCWNQTNTTRSTWEHAFNPQLRLSSAPSSKVSRRLLCASLWSCWSPASAICQMSSTVSSPSSPQHLWDSAFSVVRPRVWNLLPDHQLLTVNNLSETWRRICSLDIQSVSALEVLRNSDIYLLTYLLAMSWQFKHV